jgi:RHS repeat-associated protein
MAEELPLILSDGTNSYIYGPDGLPVEQISSGGTVTYLHHDQQGSTRLLTGSTGTVTGKCTYSAYGAPTCEGATTTPLGYDGQYTSSDTGLIYLRAREYDPATAQFLTVDPLVGETGAPYNYAGDNPLNASDPTGLEVFEEFGEGIAGWGDKLTFGATKWAREQLGDENVNTCSAAYQAGGYAALATAALIPGEDEAEAVGEFGDLTEEERAQIQDVVNRAGRPLEVVGSAARGERSLGSDIDYTTPAANYPNLQPYEHELPGIDTHGILGGPGDPEEGPSIRFEPEGEW